MLRMRECIIRNLGLSYRECPLCMRIYLCVVMEYILVLYIQVQGGGQIMANWEASPSYPWKQRDS